MVLSGRADVPEGQTVGDLVVFHGSSTVDGTVNGSLTAFDAPVTISGRVNGDVVVFNGRVVLRSGANITGDVVSQSAPVVASGATIGDSSRSYGHFDIEASRSRLRASPREIRFVRYFRSTITRSC